MSNTIKLEIEVTPKTGTIEIQLPYYCVDSNRIVKVVSESQCIVVNNPSKLQCAINVYVGVGTWIRDTKPCTREEFMIAYREALENIEKLVKQ